MQPDAESRQENSNMYEEQAHPETPSELAREYYQLVKLLGEGSYGRTFLARELRTGELVAIKELKNVKDFKSLELFKREASVLENLNVCGVPRFYNSIIPDNPLTESCYIVQEYVHFPSLQDYLKDNHKFEESETLEIIYSIAMILNILQTCYVPPIIHRDIKPSNILFDRNDLRHVYLIDFGSVATPQKRGGGSTIAGTLGYMAPEQLLGECTIQSDFYSLGATALHMLTGVAPFQMQSNGFEVDFNDAIEQHAPGTSAPMRTLIGWLMESRSEERPATASDLMGAIMQVTHGADPKAKPKSESSNESGGVVPRLKNAVWKKAAGKIWGLNSLRGNSIYRNVYDYTFIANGRTWGGVFPVERLSLPNIRRYPLACEVYYLVDNPRICTLIKPAIGKLLD